MAADLYTNLPPGFRYEPPPKYRQRSEADMCAAVLRLGLTWWEQVVLRDQGRTAQQAGRGRPWYFDRKRQRAIGRLLKLGREGGRYPEEGLQSLIVYYGKNGWSPPGSFRPARKELSKIDAAWFDYWSDRREKANRRNDHRQTRRNADIYRSGAAETAADSVWRRQAQLRQRVIEAMKGRSRRDLAVLERGVEAETGKPWDLKTLVTIKAASEILGVKEI